VYFLIHHGDKMDKVKIVYKQPENKLVSYGESVILVNPFLGVAQQAFLINRYLKEYFTNLDNKVVEFSDYDYLGAEISLKNYIFQTNTNLDTESLNNEIYVDVLFWDIITREILNYKDFRNKLAYIVQEIKEQLAIKNSVGVVLSALSDKVSNILDKFSSITPEEVENLQKNGAELMKKFEEITASKEIVPAIPVKKAGKKEPK
jgi:hypothetical protein